MPRVNSGTEAGLHFPGAYEALLDLERDRNERSDRTAARMMAEHGYFFRRNNGLLAERLAAGEPVVVRCAQLTLALWERDRLEGRVRLPFERGVKFVRVSPDDRIVPVDGD
jgi:hypothetical protein